MVFLWASVSHVPFYLPSSLFTKSSRSFGHWEQAKVILGNEEDVESMQPHGERYIAKDPLQSTQVCEVWGWKYPVLRADNLCKGLDLSLVD
jgi:hypothetical protein